MALKRKDINRGGNSNLNGYDEDTDEDEDFRSDDEESPLKRIKATNHAVNPKARKTLQQAKMASAHADQLEGMLNRTSRVLITGNALQDKSFPTAGTIKSVSLLNFMCHEKHTDLLIPNINFITGNNGSGKSTILTAITVVLGGKTAATGRANGVKDLVKSGADQAVITIKLANLGPDAIDPDRFGPLITIQRTIKAEGASTWKVLNGYGKAIDGGKPRAVISEICDLFNIQVDNPLTVLTQDQSRAFLSNSEPKKKYDMFMRCTQLSTMEEMNKEIKAVLQENNRDLQGIKEALPDREHTFREWEKKYESARLMEQVKEKNDMLFKQLNWSRVGDAEKRVEEHKGRLEALDTQLAKMQEQIDGVNESLEAARATLAEKEQAREDFLASDSSLETEIAAAEQQYKSVGQEIRAQVHKKVAVDKALKEGLRKMKEFETQRDEEFAKMGRPDQHEKRSGLESARVAVQEKIDHDNALLTKVTKDLDKLVLDRADLVKQKNSLLTQQKGLQATARNLANYVKQIEEAMSGSNQLARYGQNLQAVYDQIARSGWNHSPPIGPIGQYLKLRSGEERYQSVMDGFMSQQMAAWAVRDPRDKAQLIQIFKRCIAHNRTKFNVNNRDPNALPSVISHAGELFDYSTGDMSHLHPTVLSKLEFSNEEVKRIMINQSKIESVLICPTRSEAANVARQFSHPQQHPVISADMQRTVATRSGGMMNTVIQSWQGPSLFASDLTANLRAKQEELAVAEQDLRSTENEMAEKSSEIGKSNAEMDKCKKRQQGLRTGIREKERDLDALDRELREDEPVNVAALSEAIKEIETQKNRDADETLAIQDRIDELTKQQEPLKQKRDELRAKKQTFNETLAKLDMAVQQADAAKTAREADGKNYSRRLEAEKGKRTNLENELAEKEAALQTILGPAIELWPDRVTTLKSTNQLTKEYEASSKALRNKEKDLDMSIEIIKANMDEAQKYWLDLKTSLRQIQSITADLKYQTSRNEKRWHALKRELKNKAQKAFRRLMTERSWIGELIICHEQKELSIRVQTELKFDENGAPMMVADATKDPKALSGGETSFTTICLLLSLWDCMPCPIRCLDEFDVYMDAHNRKQSMDLIVKSAKKRDQQFILITPQSMSHIKADDPKVRVLRMKDPERGQAHLPFVPQSG